MKIVFDDGPDPFSDPALRGRVMMHIFDGPDGTEIREQIDRWQPGLIDALTGELIAAGDRVRRIVTGWTTVSTAEDAPHYCGVWWTRRSA